MNAALDNCSSGSESEYDFVSSPDNTPPSSPHGGAASPALTSSPPPKGWSTLDLSDDGPPSCSVASATTTAATTIVSAVQKATATSKEGPFHCKACSSLLRDCVECPSCHSLFCRDHLRIDRNSESPCPCEPCCAVGATAFNKQTTTTGQASIGTQNLYRSDTFLPNIPVQRMADALPSRCDACGASLSWGNLASHACDLQEVTCEYAKWGCPWIGRRQYRADHMTSSTCPGELARAEHDITEARAEIAAVRAELAAMKEAKELAERRAVMAEMRGQELEGIIAAEKNLRSKEAADAATALAAATSATSAPTAKSKKRTAAGGKESTSASAGGGGGDTTPVSCVGLVWHPPQRKNRNQPPTGERQTATTTTTTNTTTGRANAATNCSAFLNPRKSGKPAEGLSCAAATSSARQQSMRQLAGRTTGGGNGPPHVLSTRVQAAATLRGGCRTVDYSSLQPHPVMAEAAEVVDAACQAPVPATEACLRPHLQKPSSLLEKKVVVFWPRQGKWYVGRPTVYKPTTKEHRVEYDDGDVRDHVLAHRSWGLIG